MGLTKLEDFIYGRNSVLELLLDGKRSVGRIFLMKNMRHNDKIEQIIKIAKQKKIVFQFVSKEKFTQYKDVSHQGVIAYVAPVKYIELDDFLAKKTNGYKKIIITDGVEDSRNLGSIIRSAVCAGFDAVIFPSRRNTGINSAVEKSSAGAVNLIDLIMVNSLPSAINKLKDKDFWIIATDIKSVDNYYDIDYCDMNFAIVMGNEKSGVSSSVLNQADYRIKIPLIGNFDSLNVANSAGIIMYEAVKQILQKSENIV